MSYCPISGHKDCGCGAFPFTRNGLMPSRCEELMPLYMVNAHLNLVTPAKRAEYDAWVKAGMPRLEEDEISESAPKKQENVDG